jgi:thioredoxin-like negative regulator of GroEL
MFGVLVTMVLVAGGEGELKEVKTYAAAYKQSQDENKPLVVVVGAEWCPACVNLKQTTLANMEAQGELKEVSVAVVDQDKEPELARQIKQGEMIPQIVVFSRTDEGWQRNQLTGYQSRTPVLTMIRRAASSFTRRR